MPLKSVSFLFVFLFSCTSKGVEDKSSPVANIILADKSLLKPTEWLQGEWQSEAAEVQVLETWRVVSDSLMEGQSCFVRGQDTLSKESVRLEVRQNTVFYIPTVSNQNGGRPVPFQMTFSSPNSLVFENPLHDFPQKISYKKIAQDSLIAEISGVAGGKPNSIQFKLVRK